MGLITSWRIKRMKDPVEGSLTIVNTKRTGVMEGFHESTWVTFSGVLSAPGIEATALELRCLVPHPHSPPVTIAGKHESLPVIVDRARPHRPVILWDRKRVPDPDAGARARAEKLAAQMRAEGRA